VFSIFPDLENMGLDTLIRQIGQILIEILRILVWRLQISIKINVNENCPNMSGRHPC